MSLTLSGSKRILNDTVVNIHSAYQSYKSLILRGVKVIREIQSNGDNKLERNFEAIGSIVKEMGEIVEKLEACSNRLSNLYELNKASPVPFVTWGFKEFDDAAREIHQSIKKETETKSKIAHSLYDCNPDQLNFAIIGWTHLVYCVSDDKFEAMLYECTLK